MDPLTIVFVASEAAPLVKTGGLGDVIGALPRALSNMGHRACVFLPYYRRIINGAGFHPQATGIDVSVWIDGSMRHVPVHLLKARGVEFFLFEQDDLFDRPELYGPPGGAYADNPLRYTLFCRAAIEALPRLYPDADIVHCHDWQTAILPLLLKHSYADRSEWRNVKSVYTIHNLAYQGIFDPAWLSRLGLPQEAFHPDGIEFFGMINFMKAGILAADALTTVSAGYAEEILTPEYGCRLDGFLRKHAHKLRGIVNGIDTEVWNPRTDPAIAVHYGPGDLAGKRACRAQLCEQLAIEADPDVPLLAAVSRLAEQKGIDFIINALPRWMEKGWPCVILGSGDPAYAHMLRSLSRKRPRLLYFHEGFDETLSHRIYAAADIFLMPSRFEPCGLGQLIAMRYGAIPVARATGGLKDTIVDYRISKTQGTGFLYRDPSDDAFFNTVEAAVSLYRSRPLAWRRMMGRGMRLDVSWQASARAYSELYRTLL